MSDSPNSRKTALILPCQSGKDDPLSRLILKLAVIDVQLIAPDALVSTIGTGGVQVIGLENGQ